MIRKVGSKFVLYAKRTGKRLGTHTTRAGAEKQERAIQARKHAGK